MGVAIEQAHDEPRLQSIGLGGVHGIGNALSRATTAALMSGLNGSA
jgi:hypothetical protein